MPLVYFTRSEEHTSELQSLRHLVCRLLLEKKGADYIVVYDIQVHRTPALGILAKPNEEQSGNQGPSSGLSAVEGPWALFGSDFFFNDTATTEIYTLSLHDALPI